MWLDPIPDGLRAMALKALALGDVDGFLAKANNEQSLWLVFFNIAELQARGLFERALLDAFIAARTNNHGFPLAELNALFDKADRQRLRAASDPLPNAGPFTIYRGIAGRGRSRRVRGLSWTGSQERAAWFATRFPQFADPAVVTTVIDDSQVLAYCNERNEQEFIVRLSAGHRVVRPSRAQP